MVVYVDDCGIIGDSKQQVDAESEAFMEWTDSECGVKFKVSKGVPGSQQPPMIGFTWDSRTLTRSLGEVKLHSYLTELLACGESRVLTLQQRQQIAGKMQRGAMALPPPAGGSVFHCSLLLDDAWAVVWSPETPHFACRASGLSALSRFAGFLQGQGLLFLQFVQTGRRWRGRCEQEQAVRRRRLCLQ